MAKKKKLEKQIKLQIQAGKANPAPPVGPALGSAGLNIMMFCKAFNDATKDRMGDILPVVINVYADKSFDFKLKEPPMAKQLLKKAGLSKGSGVPNRDKVGTLTRADLKEVVESKMPDLRVNTIEAAIEVAAGTCRSMGIDVTD